MITKRVLFVVGAGASAEFGLPTGYGLKDILAKKLNIEFKNGFDQSSGDRNLWHCIQEYARNKGEDRNSYRAAACRIVASLGSFFSIDNLLHSRGSDQKMMFCGKIAIAQAISEAERDSKIFADLAESGPLPSLKYAESWLGLLGVLACDGIKAEDANSAFSATSFITFNYDRCIEHGIVQILRNAYGLDREAATRICNSVPVLHAYGSLGQITPDLNPHSPYGRSLSGHDLVLASERIKTFTEDMTDDEILARMAKLCQEAEIIIFLGFGFHQLNMKLLTQKSPLNIQRVLCTTKGLSSDAWEVSRSMIRANFQIGSHVDIESLPDDAAKLIAQFGRSLAS